jgi:hypothetical protein
MLNIPLFQQVFDWQGRWSYWHSVPLKPGKHRQIYPRLTLLLLTQTPLFWQGWRISHERVDILQLEPIYVDDGQVDGRKTEDDDCPTRNQWKISHVESYFVLDMEQICVDDNIIVLLYQHSFILSIKTLILELKSWRCDLSFHLNVRKGIRL